jgi:hypothetical protein
VHFSGDSLFVEAYVAEDIASDLEDPRVSEGIVNLFVFGFEVSRVRVVAPGEGVFLDGVEAVQTVVGLSDELGEAALQGSDGFQGIDYGFAEFFAGLAIFVAHDGGGSG